MWSQLDWASRAETYNNFFAHQTVEPSVLKVPQRHYVINLKRRPERLKKFNEEALKTGFQIKPYEATDGKNANIPHEFSGGPGAFGCKMSHVNVLEECLKDGIECVGVYEDDCIFAPDFEKRLTQFLTDVPDDWQALFLGGEHLSKPEQAGNVFRAVKCHRTHAYWARGGYIKTLCEVFKSSNYHIDWAWAGVQCEHRVYTPAKWMVTQSAGYSDIHLTEGEATFLPSLEERAAPMNNSECGCKKPAEVRKLIRSNQASSPRPKQR